MILVFAFLIGFIAGLRSMTAPAAVSWAAHLKWINLQNSSLSWLGSSVTAYVLALFALVELIADQLPKTPNRTSLGGLIPRMVSGALCGAALCAAASGSLAVGAILGLIGAVAGAFLGFEVRKYFVRVMGLPDRIVAIVEDIIAIVGALLIVRSI